jgi:signal peptidase I
MRLFYRYASVVFILIVGIFFDVNGQSMENCLLDGDHVYISKMLMGQKYQIMQLIYQLSILLVIFFFNNFEKHKIFVKRNRRFFSFSEVKRNDIIVYYDPFSITYYMIKRCIALPGDTCEFEEIAQALQIKESTVRSQYIRGREKLAAMLKLNFE